MGTSTWLVSAALLIWSAGCASSTATGPGASKPVASKTDTKQAQAKLEAFAARVLPGKKINEYTAHKVKLSGARLFSEGHIHETWYLNLELDGRPADMALKIFPDQARADANAAQFRAAGAQGWPIPTEFVRGSTSPYTDRPSLLMSYVTGGSLKKRIKNLFANGKTPASQDVASPYGEVAYDLGALHKKNLRPRAAGDASSMHAMKALAQQCKQEGWCGKGDHERFLDLAERMDKGPVTFVHGDLYESQIIIGHDGRVAAFIDMDEAGVRDPAVDVGSLLAHILLINSTVRKASWGVPNPSPEETRGTARAFLEAYQGSAEISDEDWLGFIRRVEGYMWLRFGQVLTKYRGNPHAKAMLEALIAARKGLMEARHIEALGVK